MIFLTVGSELPFDRLARATDRWCADRPQFEVFGQLAEPGVHGYRPVNFKWCSFMEPRAYEHWYQRADFVIAHAGMGSIITALTFSKPIVVMPRRAACRETRNDHQVATVERLGARPGIFVARDENALPRLLDEVAARSGGRTRLTPLTPFAAPELVQKIRTFILASAKFPDIKP